MAKVNYKEAGVDIKKADRFVESISSFVFSQKKNKIAAFGSLFDFKAISQKYKHPILVSSTDGVGTKLKLAQKFNLHKAVGIDLVAMNVNDIVCLGAKPLFFLDYIACGKLKPKVLRSVVEGMDQGLSESGCSLLGGETAEMPGMYKEDEYDLAGFCLGVVDKNRIMTGKNIKEGDAIIGISSSGLHSNGFSLVRKIFSQKELARQKKTLLEPTRIYVKSLLNLFSSPYRGAIKGIAHITGGAFSNKAVKIVPKGLALTVNKKSWTPQFIFKKIQKKAKLDDFQMYSTFNMGIGMIVVVSPDAAGKILKRLQKDYRSYLIGEIRKSKNKSFLLNETCP